MSLEAKTNFLDQFPLFDCLSIAEKEEFAGMMKTEVKSRYSVIYMPGDDSDQLFFLAKGAVKIGTHSADGKEVIKTLIHPLAMFGEMGIIGEKTRQDYAQVLREDVLIYSLRNDAFRQMMRKKF